MMRNWKWIVFGAAAAILAGITLARSAAQAEDFCDTKAIVGEGIKDTIEVQEQKVREKCKVGDIIWVRYSHQVGILCDLHQQIYTMGGWETLCFLAAPRKKY